MPRTESELRIARRQAEQARARAKTQQALVDALRREGMDAGRARRQLAELRLAAELLEDRVAFLEATQPQAAIRLVPAKAQRAPKRSPARGWPARTLRPSTPWASRTPRLS